MSTVIGHAPTFDPIITIEPIVDFYLDAKPLREELGFTYSDVMKFDDKELEKCHAYIQWLFPNKQPSRFNPNAPLVTNHTVTLFNELGILQDRMIDASGMMAKFYFASHVSRWITPHNHNFLRITRIMQSLKLLGLDYPEQGFYAYLEKVLNIPEWADRIGPVTIQFWKDAHDGKI